MTHLSVLDNNYLMVQCDFSEKSIVKQTGGIFDKRLTAWLMPFTTHNVEFLIDNLSDITKDKDFDEQLKKQIEKEERLEKIRKMAKADKIVKFKISGMKEGIDLFNYQKLGVLFALTTDNGVLLADACGLGKSLMSLATAVYKKNKQGIKNCLIVTLASLKWNWPKEIEKFTNEKYVVIDGKPEERIKQWKRKDVFFYITNYETIVEDLFGGRNISIDENEDEVKKEKKEKRRLKAAERADNLSEIREKIFQCMIFDEIHSCKNHEARRTKCCKKLRSEFRMGLSGTPLDGKLEELHSIFELLNPGLFENKSLFLQKHAVFDYMGNIVSYKKINVVKERIKPFFLRRLKSEVLKDLPDKINQNRYVVLSNEERKVYDDLVNGVHEKTTDAEAMQIIIRCKQFCNHPKLVGMEDFKKCSKLDSLREILDELIIQNGSKVLIFSQYSSMCEILIEVLKEMKLKFLYICGDTDKKLRADMQEQFNNDKSIDLMIGTDAMSTGLNFTSASYVINYDDFWSPSIMEQRADRCVFGGQFVQTDYGSKLIEDVEVGDLVLTHKGRFRKVLDCWDKVNKQESLTTKIEMKNGYVLETTHDHLLYVLKENQNETIWEKAFKVGLKDCLLNPVLDLESQCKIDQKYYIEDISNRKFNQYKGYYLLPINSIETVIDNRELKVYDLEVEEDNSFIVEKAVIHNCHRIGQKDTVNVINFVCKDTIEERIRDVLYNKSKISSDVLGDFCDEMVLKRLGPKDISKLL